MKNTMLEVDVDNETGQRTSTIRPMPFQEVTLMVTHDGIFHADEVFAIALIRVFVGPIPYIRTRKCMNSLNDPTVMILDQGGQESEEFNNFDHHHLKTKALYATVGLIFNYLVKAGVISLDESKVIKPMVESISAYDIHGPYQFNGFQVNEAVKFLNQFSEDENESFNEALTFAVALLKSRRNYANVELPKAKKIWNDGYRIFTNVRVCQSFPLCWKEENTDRWLVNRDKAGLWVLHAADRLPGIKLTGKETFSTGEPAFIAGYVEKDDAIEAAIMSAKQDTTSVRST